MATKHLRGPSEMRHFPARAHPASVKKQLRPAEQSASSWQAPRPASPRGVVVVAVAVVVGVAAGAIGVAVDAARRPPLDGPRPTPESCLVVSSARHAASNERRSAMKCAKRATPSSYPVRPRMYDPVLGADDRRCKRPLSLCGDRRSFMAHGPRHPKHSARPGIEPRRAPHETVPTGLDLRRMRLRFCADAVAFGPFPAPPPCISPGQCGCGSVWPCTWPNRPTWRSWLVKVPCVEVQPHSIPRLSTPPLGAPPPPPRSRQSRTAGCCCLAWPRKPATRALGRLGPHAGRGRG